MPSSYTSSLRLTLPATGENSGTWGTLVNTGITELTDAAIAGYVSIAMTDADYTLTVANGLADQARRMMLNMTGTLTGARNVICPTASKLYVIKNATTGGFAITLKTSGGSGISIPNGSSMLLMCDGTNVVDAVTQFSNGTFTNLAYTGTLTGGTGIVNLGSGQFYKDASGNVGIGTATPVSKLDVVQASGDGGLQYRSSTRTVGLGQVSSEASVYWGSGTALTFFSAVERMRLDSSGNLGIGGIPTFKLDVKDTAAATIRALTTSSGNAALIAQTLAGGAAYLQLTNAAGEHFIYGGLGGTQNISFAINGEKMRLDASGNLGIGTSSPAVYTANSRLLQIDSGANAAEFKLTNSTTGSAGSDGTLLQLSGSAFYLWNLENSFLSFGTNNTERMRLDSSGNLGLGVTPSAWTGSGATVLELGSKGCSILGSVSVTDVTYNAYYDSAWKYGLNGFASYYAQTGGTHQFFTAPSGTAGNTISFTQAMTLDASGNLGIGTSSPGAKLDVVGGIKATSSITAGALVGVDTIYMGPNGATGNGTLLVSLNNALTVYQPLTTDASVFLWRPSGTERMRLDSSGNLGIGTSSPVSKLQVDNGYIVAGTGASTTGSKIFGGQYTSGNLATFGGEYSNGGPVIGYGVWPSTSAAGAFVSATAVNVQRGAYTILGASHIWYGGDVQTVAIDSAVTTSERMRLDASGNLGLGVTPSANSYGSTKTFFMSGDSANGLLALSEESISAGSQYVSLMNNAYPDGAGTYKYKISSQNATSYRQNDGAHAWFRAGNGTAGAAISFTQAMTLDANGNLGVGTTSPTQPLEVWTSSGPYVAQFYNSSTLTSTFSVVRVSQNTVGSAIGYIGTGGSTAVNPAFQNTFVVGTQTSHPLVFNTNDTERARITSGGALVVGHTSIAGFEILCASNNAALAAPLASWNRATSGNNIFTGWYTDSTATIRGTIDYDRAGGLTRYNTTSDYRAKDIIGPVQDSGAAIDALKVYEGQMKGATQSRPMLIAHEAQEHAPYAVSGVKDEVNEDGTPKFQQIDVSSLVPLLLAEVQSLRARVAALEA